MKVTRVIPISEIRDKKRKKNTLDDFKRRHMNKGPEPPKGA